MTVHARRYDEKSYWEQRFEKESQFEWLGDYQVFRSILERYMQPTDKVLHLGCGTSRLGFDLLAHGFRQVANVDYCQSVVDRMTGRCRTFCDQLGLRWEPTLPTSEAPTNHPENDVQIHWLTADCMTMTSDPTLTALAPFDIVIDKTLTDTICCGDESEPDLGLRALAGQVGRMLKPGGRWIIISYSDDRPLETLPKQPGDCHWKVTRHRVLAPKEVTDRPMFTPDVYYHCHIAQKLASSE
ncbi:hypothetical protein H4R33_001170 [Dimargaris cristalligena]|uniref:S-adenosyl-L-methionine-dependent methyltransferase n=1 Tax=Dimargaris cristalligena TaxID=215637 RepID=A0A4P9ZWZ3_9FUNG|nr:hypothetical protein H4R33_001170 [Dimargaris cristalligena]RKP37220.1 S-adenosyl-L-methionine-dependent methyltransferase [Dimargaris cristalligena]|eukprot:RKP37220.1 S-adenosyl-L-methionine-dependent methyltransferase [Dimargaris cristalligena]